MAQKTQTPGIQVMQTPKGLLARGYLPGVTELDIEIQEDSVVFAGETPVGEFYEELPLEQPINTEYTITTYHDYQLRMVMPWRNEQ